MRGLSNSISMLILLMLILVLFVPVMLYLSAVSQNSSAISTIQNNYVYLHNLQKSQIETGHPAIYYNGSIIYLEYTNGTFEPPSNLTIVGILYLSSTGIWENITTFKYPLVISQGESLQLPSYTSGHPIIIVTSLGNLFFLTPGSAIGPYGISGKGGVEILAQIYTNGAVYSVSTNVTTNIYGNSFKNYTVPTEFPNITGTFEATVPMYVYYENSKGQIITGVFHNWAILGKASVNSTNTQGIRVTLEGFPVVLIANYTELIQQETICVESTDSNVPITVNLDGQNYTVEGNTQLTVPAGYINFTVYTYQFNDTSNESNGVIYHYVYEDTTYNGKTYTQFSMILFIPPNPSTTPTIYVKYQNNFNYYEVEISAIYKSYKGLPPPGSVVFVLFLNGTVYDYGNSYWIIGGKYIICPTRVFLENELINYGPVEYQYSYSNGTTFTYYFPDLPAYVIINQPMEIIIYYNYNMQYYPLQGD